MIEYQDYVLTHMEVHSLKTDAILIIIVFNYFIVTFLGYTSMMFCVIIGLYKNYNTKDKK